MEREGDKEQMNLVLSDGSTYENLYRADTGYGRMWFGDPNELFTVILSDESWHFDNHEDLWSPCDVKPSSSDDIDKKATHPRIIEAFTSANGGKFPKKMAIPTYAFSVRNVPWVEKAEIL